jgi:phosphohistidine phosphatase
MQKGEYRMKSVLLMRHAKSSWKDTKLKDRERPLNKRGKKDAQAMGKLLCDRELIPQLILSSSAKRARQTVDGVVEFMGFQGKVENLDELYMAEPSDIIKVLKKLPDDVERVLLMGHNPGLESLLQLWSNQISSMPTCTVAYSVLPLESWDKVRLDTEAELVEYWRPVDLMDEKKEDLVSDKKEEKKEEKKTVKKKDGHKK